MCLPVFQGRRRENDREFGTGVGIHIGQQVFVQGGREPCIAVQAAVPQGERIQHEEDMSYLISGGEGRFQIIGQVGEGCDPVGTAYRVVSHIGGIDVFGESFRRGHGQKYALIGFLL